MTTPLYRKEVLTPRSETLSGEVILHRHVPTIVITVLLLAAVILAAGVLWFGKVDTPDGPVRLFMWLTKRGA